MINAIQPIRGQESLYKLYKGFYLHLLYNIAFHITTHFCIFSVIGACNSSPCLNGATCSHTDQLGYICQCADGYTGSNCQTCKFYATGTWCQPSIFYFKFILFSSNSTSNNIKSKQNHLFRNSILDLYCSSPTKVSKTIQFLHDFLAFSNNNNNKT